MYTNSSQLFTFIEMPPQSINAGNFRVAPTLKGGESFFSQDWPGVYHNNGSVVSFVDAHVEFRRWLGTGHNKYIIRRDGPDNQSG